MTDAEVVAMWMERITKPPHNRDSQWWKSTIVIDAGGEPVYKWIPCKLTLDALHLVEERLTSGPRSQWEKYLAILAEDDPRGCNVQRKVHATTEQKIKALATVLRNEETNDHV